MGKVMARQKGIPLLQKPQLPQTQLPQKGSTAQAPAAKPVQSPIKNIVALLKTTFLKKHGTAPQPAGNPFKIATAQTRATKKTPQPVLAVAKPAATPQPTPLAAPQAALTPQQQAIIPSVQERAAVALATSLLGNTA